MNIYRNHICREVLLHPAYVRHVQHMTSEDLHGKGEIAEELASRDIRIAALEAELAEAKRVTFDGRVLEKMNQLEAENRQMHIDYSSLCTAHANLKAELACETARANNNYSNHQQTLAEVAELRKDAERLNYIEQEFHCLGFDKGDRWMIVWRGDEREFDTLREACDAAMGGYVPSAMKEAQP